jgi:hypothetical protein
MKHHNDSNEAYSIISLKYKGKIGLVKKIPEMMLYASCILHLIAIP